MRPVGIRAVVVAVGLCLSMALALPGGAIVGGQLDGNRHPEVGGLIFDDNGQKALICSGELLSSTVFLTAGHCVDFLISQGVDAHDVWVTFDSTFDASSPLRRGTYHIDPQFGTSSKDPHDLAVVVLDRAVSSITPARLPELGRLDRMKRQGTLASTLFTAVGYGDTRTSKTGGPHALQFDATRRYAIQSFQSLKEFWLTLSENAATGNGGSCYGDSGGPHFIGAGSNETPVVASITVTGDVNCRSTDTTYRVDTQSARDFLGQFVTLP